MPTAIRAGASDGAIQWGATTPADIFTFTGAAITLKPNLIPCCTVKLSAAQTVVSGSPTAIAFNTKTGTDWFDLTGAFNTTAFQWKPLLSGYYYMSSFMLTGASTTASELRIRKNGVGAGSGNNYIIDGNRWFGSSTIGCNNLSGIMYMNGSTDYIEVFGTITGTTSILAGSTFSSFLLMRDI